MGRKHYKIYLRAHVKGLTCPPLYKEKEGHRERCRWGGGWS